MQINALFLSSASFHINPAFFFPFPQPYVSILPFPAFPPPISFPLSSNILWINYMLQVTRNIDLMQVVGKPSICKSILNASK